MQNRFFVGSLRMPAPPGRRRSRITQVTRPAGPDRLVHPARVREPSRKSTLAGRARPASGWFVQERARDPDRNPARRRALVPLGQKRAGVFRRLATRVWA